MPVGNITFQAGANYQLGIASQSLAGSFGITGNCTIEVDCPTATINSAFIGSGGTSGTDGLTKTGTGNLVLNSYMAYAGATTVLAGTLELAPNWNANYLTANNGVGVPGNPSGYNSPYCGFNPYEGPIVVGAPAAMPRPRYRPTARPPWVGKVVPSRWSLRSRSTPAARFLPRRRRPTFTIAT